MAVKKFKLSPEQLKKLDDLSEDITALESEISKAKSVGIEVSKIETQLSASKVLRSNLIKVYGTI